MLPADVIYIRVVLLVFRRTSPTEPIKKLVLTPPCRNVDPFTKNALETIAEFTKEEIALIVVVVKLVV